MTLLAELQRRNVIRMAGLYLVVAWLLVQVASVTFPAFELPAWALRGLILLLALGLVPVLIFAWLYELTPEGLRRDAEAAPDAPIAARTRRRMDRMLVAGLAIALAWFALDRYLVAPEVGSGSISGAPATVPATAPAPEIEPDPISDKSIAVLAFADMSPGKDSEYLGDGVAEEILNALAQVEDLKVAGRTSSFYFKGRNEKLTEIAAALGVANVLEGSVRRQGDKVRITAQLIRASDGFHRWSDSYDGDIGDVFALQERIARAITSELEAVLSDRQRERLVDTGTTDPQAYSLYLRGRYFWNLRTPDSVRQAIEQFRAAAAADPGFALAYSGIADSYLVLPYFTGERSDRTRAQAQEYAERALAIDPRSAEALASMAYVRQGEWAWAEAERLYQRALEINPRYVTAQFWYARLLARTGRSEAALERYRLALEYEPLSRIVRDNLVQILLQRGELEEALAEQLRALELAPDYPANFMNYSHVLTSSGRAEEALAAAEQGLALSDQDRIRWAKMRALTALGRGAEAEPMAADIEARYERGEADAFAVAAGWAAVGNADAAFRWLDRARADRSAMLVGLRAEAVFIDLQDDPRFGAMIDTMKLQAPAAAERAP